MLQQQYAEAKKMMEGIAMQIKITADDGIPVKAPPEPKVTVKAPPPSLAPLPKQDPTDILQGDDCYTLSKEHNGGAQNTWS